MTLETRVTSQVGRLLPMVTVLLLAAMIVGCAQSPIRPGSAAGGADDAGSATASPKILPVEPLAPNHRLLFDQALDDSRHARWAEAEGKLSALASDRPDVASVRSQLAWAVQQQGRDEEALKLYQEALALAPSNPMTINNLALLLKAKGEFREAQRLLQEGLKYSNDVPELHYNLAVLSELYLLDLDAALTHYQAYQTSAGLEDGKVKGWIADLERRLQ